MEHHYDIAIVGGGPAGASLACCLAGSNVRVAVLERYPAEQGRQPSYDDRGLALSLSSCRVLDAMGVWDGLADMAAPVRHVHISDRGKFGVVRLHASDLNIDAMGYVVTARELGLALLEKLSTLDNVDYLCPVSVSEFEIDTDEVRISTEGDAGTATLHCRLLVAADGSGSFVRNRLGLPARLKDYDQSAIVSNITVDADHRDTAYERFTLRGPVALLPMPGSRFVSVFCVPAGLQAGYMDMDPEEYIRALQEVLGNRAGRITAVGCRSAYPLRLIQANSQIAERTVLLGNAAHTVHPNGAQGFNLALRDVAALAELLRRCDIVQGDPGSQGLLRDYVACRSLDQERVVNFTDSLTGLFYNDNLFKAIGRNLGMLVLDSVPLFKNKFARLAMGLEGRQPGLVRGLSLDQL